MISEIEDTVDSLHSLVCGDIHDCLMRQAEQLGKIGDMLPMLREALDLEPESGSRTLCKQTLEFTENWLRNAPGLLRMFCEETPKP